MLGDRRFTIKVRMVRLCAKDVSNEGELCGNPSQITNSDPRNLSVTGNRGKAMGSKGQNKTLTYTLSRTRRKNVAIKWRRFCNVVFVVLVSFLATSITVESSSINDCRNVRFAYSSRGLDLKDVPRQPRQGIVKKYFTFGFELALATKQGRF